MTSYLNLSLTTVKTSVTHVSSLMGSVVGDRLSVCAPLLDSSLEKIIVSKYASGLCLSYFPLKSNLLKALRFFGKLSKFNKIQLNYPLRFKKLTT